MKNDFMLDIPFVKQINDCTCGAACLQMIFSYYGVSCNQLDIFQSIQAPSQSGNSPYCDLTGMVLYANSLGIPCAGVVPKEPASFLKLCLKNDINVILLYHEDEASFLGHFGVLTGIAKNQLYIHDPFVDNGRNKSYPFGGFTTRHMKRKESLNGNPLQKDDIGCSYSMLLLVPPARLTECEGVQCEVCGTIFPIMSKVSREINLILCPDEGNWKPIR